MPEPSHPSDFYRAFEGRRALYLEGATLDLVRLDRVDADGERLDLTLVPEGMAGLAPLDGPTLETRLARAFGEPDPPQDRLSLSARWDVLHADTFEWSAAYVGWRLLFDAEVIARAEAAARDDVASGLTGHARKTALLKAIAPYD